MNKRGHVLNAVLLSIGLGYVLHPTGDETTFLTIVEVGMPVLLGALVPDVDTAFGRHRKTLHNLTVLAAFLAFPHYFDNLRYVWVGVLTHYVLDVLGTTRGIALFYPVWDREFNAPVGIPVDSDYTDLVTIAVTALEVGAAALLVYQGPKVLEEGRRMLGL